MNKKSNFTRTVLLGALLCGIAGPSFVGCKDYDDDIENLQVQIDANKDAIAKLQELVNGGAIVTSVESDGNGGVVITLSDGSTHNITKGEKGDKGDKGDQGDQGVQGLPGDPGTPGAVPTFKIENGELMYTFESGDAAQWTSVGKVEAEAPVLDFEIDEATGELLLNGESLGVVKGEKGDQGDPGTPAPALQVKFEVRTDGHLWYSSDNGTTWADLGEVKGPKGDAGDPGNTPTIPTISFSYDEENGLMYQVGTEAAQPIAGFDMAALIADNVKLTVNEEGNLCLNGTPIDPAIEIKNNIYVVKGDGFITLNVPVYIAETDTYAYETLTLPTTDIFGKIVTSVNFVPMTPQGNDLSVSKLKVLDPTTGVVAVPADFVRATQSELRFRVNPSTAVYGKDKDFTVAESMDYFLASRAADGMFKALNPEVREDGLLYVDFAFDAEKVATDKTYTLALALNDNHNEGRTIYSNYITFSADGSEVKNLGIRKNDLSSIDLEKLELEWKEGAVLDLSAEGLVAVGEDTESGLTTYTPLSNYGFSPEIKITTTETGIEKDFIKVDGLKLTLNDPTYQTLNQVVDFNVDVEVDGKLVHREVMKVTIKQFEDERAFPGLVANQTVNDFIKGQVTLTEDDLKLSASKWNEIETFFGADAENTTISWSVNGTELTAYNDDNCDLSFFEKWNSASKSVIVKADAEPGVYNVTMKLTDGGVKVATSTFTITVNAPTFSKRQNYWDAENNITVRVDRNGALTATLSEALVLDNADLSDDVHFVFEPTAKFEDIVTVSGTNSDVVTWVGDAEHTIPVNGYSNVEMVYYLVNASGTPVTEEMTCGVRFYNPLRTPVFTETVIDMHDAEEAEIDMTELAINMLVNDRVSGSDIPVIAESVLCDGTEGTANADTYGVKISYSSKDSRIDTETVEGKVYWKNTVSLAPGTVEEVTVTVTIENNWSVYTQDVTIRVAATK